eukprot:TRINITY_DN54013_c0_g1_i1.p2 TRINITY_DN54013_c0_g1~~TRINITY_DN54013_c0_g1_i1.p2  ORF type:complete len:379 (-),score=107.54 TRINITY_DN54013_c0_g1_i1:83-1219(-)
MMLGASQTSPAVHADLEHISYDQALTRKIMAKREAEMARRAKLLDPRTRQRGVAHHVLDAQVEEKRSRQSGDDEEEAYHAHAAVLQEQVAQACEIMKAQGTRDRHKAALEYSTQHLGKEQRREYHLSDPNELRNERVRSAEELAQLGPACCQSIGEVKSEMDARRRQKQLETRAWLQEQMREKEERAAQEREIDLKFDREAEFANQIRSVCEQAAIDEARQDKIQEAEDNKRIAEEHRQRRMNQFQKHLDANARHVDSIVNSDRMKETVDYAIGSHGKLLRTEYKRPSIEEEQDVHDTNAFQVLNKLNRAKQEKMEDMEEAGRIQHRTQILGHIEDMKVQQTYNNRMKMEAHNATIVEARKRNARSDRLAYLSFVGES